MLLNNIREQTGTDVVDRFDYQLALAMYYLINSKDENICVLLETLEDFALIKNVLSSKPEIDIFQVKTKRNGLMDKSVLNNEKVYGKIYLTDFYVDHQAKSLNVICNANLKGKTTENKENFLVFDELSKNECEKIMSDIESFFLDNKVVFDIHNIDKKKLFYIRTDFPLSDNKYEESLTGKINEFVESSLYDKDISINPSVIFKTLSQLMMKKRKIVINNGIDLSIAVKSKGITIKEIKDIISSTEERTTLSKKDLLDYCSKYLPAYEFEKIKNSYSIYISYRNNYDDNLYKSIEKSIREIYNEHLIKDRSSLIGEIIKRTIGEALELESNVYDQWITSLIVVMVAHG